MTKRLLLHVFAATMLFTLGSISCASAGTITEILYAAGLPDALRNGAGATLQQNVGTSSGIASTYSGSTAYATYHGSGFAAVGSGGVLAFIDSLQPNTTGLYAFETASGWVDTLSVNANSQSTTYQWKPTVKITGNSSWMGSATTGPVEIRVGEYLQVGANPATIVTDAVLEVPTGSYTNTVALSGVQVPANTPFDWGLIFIVMGITSTSQTSPATNITSITGDFSHTFSVTGLTVTDGTNPLQFTATSASGGLYTQAGITAAPEPSTVALLAIGLVGLLVFAGRRTADVACASLGHGVVTAPTNQVERI